jgi:hypothetical protein
MTATFYQARVGSNYKGWRDAAEIARDVRADLKAASKAGAIPADVKVSVRCEKYAGGQSVKVGLSGWERSRIWDIGSQGWKMTEEAQAVESFVEGIRESYNRDASDAMTDYFEVVYYGTTNWNY